MGPELGGSLGKVPLTVEEPRLGKSPSSCLAEPIFSPPPPSLPSLTLPLLGMTEVPDRRSHAHRRELMWGD